MHCCKAVLCVSWGTYMKGNRLMDSANVLD